MSRTTTRSRRLLTGLALTPLALGLVACGSDDDDAATPSDTVTVTETPSDSGSTSATPDASPSTGGDAGGDEAGLLAAAETALADTPGTVTTVDRDDNGWDVTVVTSDGTETDFDISADGATIERGPDADDNDDNDRAEQLRLVEAAQLDYVSAIDNARGNTPATLPVVGVDLTEENDQVVWEVDFADGNGETTVLVDAATGANVPDVGDGDDDNDDD